MKILKSFLFHFAFIAISGVFLYIGFQSAHVELHRNNDGTVDGSISRSHFIGLYNTHDTIHDVKGAKLASRNNYAGPRTTTRHAVLIFSKTQSVPLFRYNDFGYSTLENIQKQLNSYLSNNTKMVFDQRFNMNNAAGAFGVLFFVLWILIVFRVFR